MPVPHFPHDQRIRALRVVAGHACELRTSPDAGPDAQSAGGWCPQIRYVLIGQHDLRQRPRDRSRGHQQHVRRNALGAECFALGDAEAVLLVHDRHRQTLEGDLLLDQGVRADCDLRLAACDPRPRRLVLLRW